MSIKKDVGKKPTNKKIDFAILTEVVNNLFGVSDRENEVQLSRRELAQKFFSLVGIKITSKGVDENFDTLNKLKDLPAGADIIKKLDGLFFSKFKVLNSEGNKGQYFEGMNLTIDKANSSISKPITMSVSYDMLFGDKWDATKKLWKSKYSDKDYKAILNFFTLEKKSDTENLMNKYGQGLKVQCSKWKSKEYKKWVDCFKPISERAKSKKSSSSVSFEIAISKDLRDKMLKEVERGFKDKLLTPALKSELKNDINDFCNDVYTRIINNPQYTK